MKIKTKIAASVRAEALLEIDRQAEEARGAFITLGAGQALVYEQKVREAEAFVSGSTTNPDLLPHLASEAEMNGISLLDQAAEYLTMQQLWVTISPRIEIRRLAAKAAVANAVTHDAIREAVNIDWSGMA